MTEILEGRTLARTIRSEVAERVERFVAAGGRPPCLAAVLVGDDPASHVYVRSKGKALDRAGCTSGPACSNRVQSNASLSPYRQFGTR